MSAGPAPPPSGPAPCPGRAGAPPPRRGGRAGACGGGAPARAPAAPAPVPASPPAPAGRHARAAALARAVLALPVLAILALALALALPGRPAATQDLGPARAATLLPPLAAEGWDRPFPGARVRGLLTFRGNPARGFHGEGPLPDRPAVLWRAGPYCGLSTDEAGTRQWCGTGWTGQPAIRTDARGRAAEVIFGAYDHAVHFLDPASGRPLRAAFPTGDLIKGSVSLDPTGAPLLYVGSRDDRLRILRLDAGAATELWSLDANAADGIWNNDWDASPLVLGDHLLAASENGWLYVLRLGRHRDGSGRAGVAPVLVNRIAGFTPALFARLGDRMASIESSPMAQAGRLYLANSGGLVQGYDLALLLAGAPRAAALTLEYFAGDDVDATLVAGPDGAVYVAVEDERPPSPDKAATGHLARLEPERWSAAAPGAARVWGLAFPGRSGGKGGVWATPALHRGYLHVPTHAGGLYTVAAATGAVTNVVAMAPHGWSSPAVIAGDLLVAACDGTLYRFSLADPARPRLRWSFRPPGSGCWESTPAVWQGVIYLGNRDGHFYAIGEGPPAPARPGSRAHVPSLQ
ncbi:MAG: PQQ-like beta-propeller repeat protein [Rhodobacteraceae bacterium]|nr:PQQ-like beta-propeller repeat protein [Paracoccaceae bacterium]